jgi:hypothetical protein
LNSYNKDIEQRKICAGKGCTNLAQHCLKILYTNRKGWFCDSCKTILIEADLIVKDDQYYQFCDCYGETPDECICDRIEGYDGETGYPIISINERELSYLHSGIEKNQDKNNSNLEAEY